MTDDPDPGGDPTNGSGPGGPTEAGDADRAAPEPPDPEAAARLEDVLAGNERVEEEINAVFDGRAENLERVTRAVARSMYLAGYDQAMEDVRNSMAGEGSPESADDLSSHLSESFQEDYERLLENLTGD